MFQCQCCYYCSQPSPFNKVTKVEMYFACVKTFHFYEKLSRLGKFLIGTYYMESNFSVTLYQPKSISTSFSNSWLNLINS